MPGELDRNCLFRRGAGRLRGSGASLGGRRRVVAPVRVAADLRMDISVRRAERVVAPAGLQELIRAAYTDAFYVGYGDRQQLADSESQDGGPLDPFVFTAAEQDDVDTIVRHLG